jgi:serine/threonine protein kinase
MSRDRDDAPGGSPPSPTRGEGADAHDDATRTLGPGATTGEGGGRDTSSLPAAAGPGAAEGAVPPRGTRLGHFRIEQPLGEGGAGRVFAAEDLDIPGRRVALKLIRAGGLTPDLEALRREASALAHLRHPHILVVHEIGSSEWGPYLVTEWMDAGSLAARLRHGPLPERLGLRLARGIASALAAAHARGLLHRDIKPANLLLGAEEGAVKVADFGLVWRRAEPDADDAASATERDGADGAGGRRGMVSGKEHALNRGVMESAGTPPYIAPEVLEGDPPDAAADQFAFGVTLCEMLSGRRPFEGPDWGTKVMSGAAAIPPGMTRDVEAVVRRAIARRPADRFTSMAEVVAALDRILAHRDPRRRRLVWTIGTAATLFVLLVGGWGLVRVRAADRARALNEAGRNALERGDHDAARRAFLEAHGADPSFLPACASLGQLAAGERNPTWAITILEECAATFPEAAVARYNLGAALHLTGRAAEAEQELRLALRHAGNSPVRPLVLNELAMVLLDAGRAADVVALLEPELPFRTDQVEGAILSKTLGLAFVSAGRALGGAPLLRAALAGPLPPPQQRAALVGLGRALETTGDAAGALEAYSRALLAAGTEGGGEDDAVAAAARAGLARLQP